MLQHIKLRKFLPLVVLIGLAVLAGGTDVFSQAIHVHVIEVGKEYLLKLKPMAADIFVGLVFICLAYLLYDPAKAVLERGLRASDADDKGRQVISRAVSLVYWTATVFLGVSLIAPHLMSELFVGIGLITAAVAVALKDIAADFVSGVLLTFSPKCKVGDEIKIVGYGVQGKVLDIGYVGTRIDSEGGVISVPNSDVWGRALQILEAGKPAGQGS